MAIKVGYGSHTYELEEGWGKLPKGIQFGYTHGVVVDSQDRVYVHNQSKDAVVVFDRDGRFLTSWGVEFKDGAHGMFLSKANGNEYLYLSDYARHVVVKSTLDGKVVMTLGLPDIPEVYDSPEKYKPTECTVAPNGDIYVCDGYGQSWVHQYSPGGKRIRSWGGAGREPGKMICPHGIRIDTRGNEPVLYVADRGNSRIQIFSLEGIHRGFVTYDMRMPCCFYQFEDEVYIPDLHARITILDKNNDLVEHIGDRPGVWRTKGWPNIPHSERVPGKFSSPHNCCVDSRGDLYVVEWISDGRLTKLRRIR